MSEALAKEELPADLIAQMPLHEITNDYGTPGLKLRFNIELNKLSEKTQERLQKALSLAEKWHDGQERTNGPYLDHLLRVMLRVLCYYEIDDPDILIAALLHDSVEDQRERIAGKSAGREDAYAVITREFNTGVTDILRALTNPPGDISVEEYNDHVREYLIKEPRAIPVKLSDFTDNAVGINYTVDPLEKKGQKGKKFKLARKYIKVTPFYEQVVEDDIYPFTPAAKAYIQQHLVSGRRRLTEILRNHSDPGDIGSLALQ